MLDSPVNDGCVVTSILHESIHGLFCFIQTHSLGNGKRIDSVR